MLGSSNLISHVLERHEYRDPSTRHEPIRGADVELDALRQWWSQLRSPASTRMGSLFAGHGSGQVAYGLKTQGGL